MTNEIRFIQVTPDELTAMIADAVVKGFEQAKEFFNKPTKQSEYLTRKETAKRLKISLGTLDNWTKSGKLTSHKIDRKVLYKECEIEEFINKAVS